MEGEGVGGEEKTVRRENIKRHLCSNRLGVFYAFVIKFFQNC